MSAPRKSDASPRKTAASLAKRIGELEAALQQRDRTEQLYLAALRQTTSPSGDIQNLNNLFEAIITHAGTLLNTSHGLLQLLDEKDEAMRLKVGIGLFRDYLEDRTLRGKGITGRVWETGMPMVVPDYDSSPNRGNSLRPGICRDICAAPIKVDEKIIGIIALAHIPQDPAPVFTEEALNILTGFAEVAAITINNARLYETAREHILERLQAEAALHEVEENYRDLFEKNPNINILVGPDRRIMDVNEAALRATGFTKEEFVGRDVVDYMTPEQRSGAIERFERAIRGEITPLMEISIVGRSGVRTLLLPEGHVPFHKNGIPVGFILSAIDITELKWAEEELANTYALMMAAIKQISAGVLVAEAPDASIRIANPAALALRGDADRPLTNIPYNLHSDNWQTYYPDGRPYPPEMLPLTRAIREGIATRDMEAIIRRQDGQQRWVLASAAPVHNQKGAIVAGVAVLTDITDRKRAEELLKESEAKFRTLFEDSRDAIYISTAAGRFVDLNPAATELFGYSRDELIALDIVQLYEQPDDRERFRREIETAGFVRDFPARLRRKDGSVIDCLNTATIRLDGKGNVLGYQGIIRDISLQKEAEQALRESEERFRTITEQSLVGIFVLKDDRLVFVNKAIQDILGYSRETAINWTFDDFHKLVHPDDHELVFGEIEKKLRRQDEVRLTYEFRIITRDGSVRWLLIHSNTITWEGEAAIAGAVLDITERKLAEERLRFKNTLDELITAISTHFINLSPDAIDRGINLALKDIGVFVGVCRSYFLHISSDSGRVAATYEWTATGVEPRVHLVTDRPLSDVSWLAERINWGETVHIPRMKDLHPDSRAQAAVWVAPETQSVIVVPIVSSGEVVGAFGFDAIKSEKVWSDDIINLLKIVGEIFVNALERKRMEDALRVSEAQFRQAQKMEAVGQLAGGVAHDFNNLLTVISGNTELMTLGLGEYDPLRKNLEEVQKATDRAANLVKQLLAFSRKQALEPRVVALNDVIADMRKMLQRLIGEDIELTFRPSTDLWNVKVDSAQFQQVLVNLAVNARDAMPNGGNIRLETRNVELTQEFAEQYEYVKPGKYILASFSDSGVGMNDDVRSRIFLPFFTTKAPGKGTGLGLSMVYGVVKQSGGYILVFSEPGKGTTFNIYLPVVEEAVERVSSRTLTEEFQGGSETILVVEDEDSVREMAVNALTMVGYNILKASSGREALDICQRLPAPVDLVLTDMVMPLMSGFELGEELRRLWPGVKLVYMSGYSTEAVVQKGMLDPATPYIQKPFRLGYLTRKVRETLDA
jgi:PAS domain S-box-containing protein